MNQKQVFIFHNMKINLIKLHYKNISAIISWIFNKIKHNFDKLQLLLT
jgi:hypothetical protein